MKRDVQGQTELRVKVAELCGWKRQVHNDWGHRWKPPGEQFFNSVWSGDLTLPDYPNDLNACHQFEETLTIPQRRRYVQLLDRMFDDPDCIDWPMIHASAEQRCRAFVATMEGSPVPEGNDLGSDDTNMKVDTYKHLDDDNYGQLNVHLKMPEVAEKVCALNYGAHRLLSAMVHELRKRNDHFLATTARPEIHEKVSPLAAELERILNAGFYY